MRIVIVGSVAAGTSVGAKARRASEDVEIAVYDRDRDVSYSGCGIPFLVGGEVADVEELRPRDAAWFASRYRMDVRTRHDVVAVDHPARTVTVRDLETGEELTDSYDVLVLATGARPVVPDVPGVGLGGVHVVRNPSDGEAIRAFVADRPVRRAVVVGGGYIGLEMAEQLAGRGVEVALVEAERHVMPRMDPDMSARVDAVLARHGVDLRLGARLTAVEDDGAGVLPADRRRIFDRFTRLDDSRTRASGGSGLGLAIVAEIVAAHHGTVRVVDGRSGGARFEVELPAQVEPDVELDGPVDAAGDSVGDSAGDSGPL